MLLLSFEQRHQTGKPGFTSLHKCFFMVGNRRLTAYHRLIDVPCVICVNVSFFL